MEPTPLFTRATWEGDLDEAYDRAVDAWKALGPGPEAEAFYRREVFPLSCERFRRDREGVAALDLLYVPVGTQPYAPTLAALANPAACVALLETETSAPYGRVVEAALAGEGGPVVLHVRVHETAVADIALAIRDVFDTRALPSGSRVGADTTGGTKVMTAAMAGVGSLYGWRLFYVASTFERSFGLSHHERVVVLDNVLEVFGARRREEALALLRAGSCWAAEQAFLALVAESAASTEDRHLAALAAAAGALRRGEPGFLKHHLREAAAALKTRVPRSVGVLVQEAAGQAESVLDGGRVEAGALAWLGARTSYAEGSPPAARALAEAAARALGEPAPGADETLPQALQRLAGSQALRPHRPVLGWLKRHLGEGLAQSLDGSR